MARKSYSESFKRDARNQMNIHRLLVFIVWLAMCGSALGLTVTITPNQRVYTRHEPIVARITIVNDQDRDVVIILKYPKIGVGFYAEDPRVEVIPQPMTSTRGWLKTLSPGERVERMLALNRHLQFRDDGEYTIRYECSEVSIARQGQQPRRPATHSGNFVLRITSDPLPEQVLEE